MTGSYGSKDNRRCWVPSKHYSGYEWCGGVQLYRSVLTGQEHTKDEIRENVHPDLARDWRPSHSFPGWEHSPKAGVYRRRVDGKWVVHTEKWAHRNGLRAMATPEKERNPNWVDSLDHDGWEHNISTNQYRRPRGTGYEYSTWSELRKRQTAGSEWPDQISEHTTTEGEDMGGDFKTPLEFKKEDLVGRLEETLSANEAEREVKRAEAAAKTAESKDKLDDYLDRYPELLVFLADQVRRNFGHGLNDAGLADVLASSYPVANAEGLDERRDPDAELKRLIAALKLSSNETVELEVTNAAYKYIGTGPVEA